MTFVRALDTGDILTDAILNNSEIGVIVAMNPQTNDFAVMHPLQSHDSLYVNLVSGTSKQNPNSNEMLLVAHGILMFISWSFFAVISIVFARFFKFIGKAWFRLHVVFNVLTTVISGVAFVIIIAAIGNGWTNSAISTPITLAHSWIGLVVELEVELVVVLEVGLVT